MGQISIKHISKEFASPSFDERQRAIDMIVIHATNLPCKKWIDEVCNAATKLSCHYLIDLKGKIYQLVADDKRAWHAGKSYWRGRSSLNNNSIGIELVDTDDNGVRLTSFPKLQMNSLIDLLKLLIKKYKVSNHNIVAHSDIAPDRKADPGENFDWSLLAAHKIGLYHNVRGEDSCFLDPKMASIIKVKELQRMLKAFGYKIRITGKFDTQTMEVVLSFKRRFNPVSLCKSYFGSIDFKILSTILAQC